MKRLGMFLLSAGIGAGLGLATQAASADNWPQWRGPSRDGVSKETGLLKEWPEAGPKMLWKVSDLGGGYSTPSIVGDRLYLISNEGNDAEFVRALATADGSEIWSTKIGKVGKPDQRPPYPGSRGTATVDGDTIYALGSDGDLVSLEAATGKLIWKKHLVTDFGGESGIWAYSESPLIDGEKLIVTPGGSEATIIALDKKTGDTLWKFASEQADQAAYASPVIIEAAGKKQYVQFLQKGLVGVDAESGKLLWRYEGTAQGSPANIPTPVFYNELVYSASSRGGGGAVKIKTAQGTIEAEEVFHSPTLPNSIGGTVEVDGHLYGTTRQGLTCVDFATGEIKWQDRSIGASSIAYADGRLYLHGESGEVALVEPTPEGYRELGRFTPPDQPDRGNSKAWAYPAIANGRLYLHDYGTLWAYDIGAK